MKGEGRIEEAFLKLLKKYEVDKIDVSLLCKEAKITRQTFYYYYQSIYDLIFAIYINKRVKSKNNKSIKVICENLIDFLFEDDKFNREIATSNASSVLNEFSYSFIYQSMCLFLTKYRLDSDNLMALSRFYSKALSEEIIYLYSHLGTKKEDIINKIEPYIDENLVLNIIKNLN